MPYRNLSENDLASMYTAPRISPTMNLPDASYDLVVQGEMPSTALP